MVKDTMKTYLDKLGDDFAAAEDQVTDALADAAEDHT
jgi:hypothetical protein